MFTVEGLQVPTIGTAFDELVGSTGAVAFRQTDVGIVVKTGVILGKIVTAKVWVVAQGNNEAFGVKT